MRENAGEREWVSGSRHRTRTGRTAQGRGFGSLRQRNWQGRLRGTEQRDMNRNQKSWKEWGYDQGIYKQATAFFFTNIPDNWSYTDMWGTFRKYGRVLAIYSPQRRCKNGSRFGFVRFLEVKNERELEGKLDQIRVAGRKIWVNLAKYPEEETGVKAIRKGDSIKTITQGKSYADAVRGYEGRNNKKSEGQPTKKSEYERGRNEFKEELRQPAKQQEWKIKSREAMWSGMEYNVKEEDYEWLQGCYVGIAHSVDIVPNLQEKFYMEGYFSCRLRAMGGKMLLMDCEDKEELKDLVQGASDWLGQWFSEVKPWSPSMVAKERFVWIRCQGVPMLAWGPDFFQSMAAAWGKFICVDDSTSKKRRFDVARFLISTSIMDSISVNRQIKINGIMYNIKFSEEELTNSLFSLKYDFLPRFMSDSENEEDWSVGSNDQEGSEGINSEAGDFKKDFEFQKERYEVGQDKESDNLHHSRQVEEDSVEVVADSINLEKAINSENHSEDSGTWQAKSKCKYQLSKENSKSIRRSRAGLRDKPNKEVVGQVHSVEEILERAAGDVEAVGLSEQRGYKVRPNLEEIRESPQDLARRSGDGMAQNSRESYRRGSEGENRNEGMSNSTRSDKKIIRKKIKPCRLVYKRANCIGLQNQKMKGKGKSKGKKAQRIEILEFLPRSSNSVVGDSVRDSGIENRNKSLKEHQQQRMAGELWNFAKKLGVVADDEEAVLKNLEEMEVRDRRAKELETVKGASTEQKVMGMSGGLLCVWNTRILEKVQIVEGEHFIGIEGVWGPEKVPVKVINVYSPCQLSGKRALWEELKNLAAGRGGNWCFVGDFNAVRSVEEKTGNNGLTAEIREFDGFIREMELNDLPLIGRKFTWYQASGRSMSRIDRVLLSDGWLSMWSEARQWGLCRSVSDHCPIVLKHQQVDWGPKPFRLFDAWLEKEGCRELIREVWRKTNIEGWAGFRLKEKLKKTKEALRNWSRNFAPEVDNKINKATAIIAQLDVKGENGQLSEEEIISRREAVIELWENIRSKESRMQQKSRKVWLANGDANTKFFHNCVKGRRKRNEMSSIQINGNQIVEPNRMKEEIASFFEKMFTEEWRERPTLEGVQFNQISMEQNVSLIAPFSESEIKAAIWECECSKAPGPDGFNFGFVKSEWDTIKEEVIEFIHEFQKNSKLVKGLNTSFIVLIPKVVSPQKIEDYRPISLLGAMYKILAKLLANRLKEVLEGVIGEQQMAFIRGRQLMDGVVIANEMIDEAKKKKKKSFMLKIDFEKAYDKVSWNFLEYMMKRMGFSETWRNWIKECLKTCLVSVLVNGSPTRQFSISRGLRQGDPLSPFLFTIIAEGLNGLISTASKKGLLEGVEMGPRGFKVTHLQYADDTILFGKATEENIWAMKGILRAFELVSGLKINFNKSQLMGLCVEEGWVEKMAWVLCCKKGSLPFKYLGIPIGGCSRKLSFWKPLVDIFKKKLSTWKGRYLSLGGRITLMNSVLSNLPVFWMSVYLIPKGTLLLLDKIRRRFLWGGTEEGKRVNWVKWGRVCKDKERGGLGVKDLRKFNMALLGKWWGRLVSEDSGLWKKIIYEKYGREGDPSYNWLRENTGLGSRWWRDVGRVNVIAEENRGWLEDGLKLKVGEGIEVSFWWDSWCGKGSLANKFPRLYLISTGKNKKINQMGKWNNGIWIWNIQWRRNLYSWEKMQEVELLNQIHDITIERGKKDLWEWQHNKDGRYTTKSAYKALSDGNGVEQPRRVSQMVWNSLIPTKISIFVWQLLQNKIPTRSNLFKRGILKNPEECKCIFYGVENEDSNHLFIHCKIASDLWRDCYKWWGIRTVQDKDCKKVFEQHPNVAKMTTKKIGWECIWFTVTWTIWLARNEKIFKQKEVDRRKLLEMVQIRAFNWIKGKREGCYFSLSDWIQYPTGCLKFNCASKRKD
ncbi:hypothetical protein SLEP1_g51849 [Rubroshorea leprosula]|uniref:Reverse transcriptase domain-containing protein n=1 Tax=Rubroshorea leprosula TaxID=152421 RepID=A0AAV5M4H8_9ROSI|nr:hypothetical protein SLEP1_g51849 [Rubroshorea leprosula]